VCAVEEKTLARKSCGHIDSTPDGVVYVAPTKEVWVTVLHQVTTLSVFWTARL
jgi:hypothetical protein